MRAVEEEQIGRDARVRREDNVRQSDDRVKVEVLEQFFLDPRETPSPKSVPLGTTTAALPGFGGRLSLRMMSWRNSKAVSEVCLSSGKLPRMPRSSSPPKGGLVMMRSTRSRSPISRKESADC
jgi:hypothetical protein